MVGVRTPQQLAGDEAEQAVAHRLEAAGWLILGRHVRVGRGELDLIALDPGTAAGARGRRGSLASVPDVRPAGGHLRLAQARPSPPRGRPPDRGRHAARRLSAPRAARPGRPRCRGTTPASGRSAAIPPPSLGPRGLRRASPGALRLRPSQFEIPDPAFNLSQSVKRNVDARGVGGGPYAERTDSRDGEADVPPWMASLGLLCRSDRDRGLFVLGAREPVLSAREPCVLIVCARRNGLAGRVRIRVRRLPSEPSHRPARGRRRSGRQGPKR